MSKKYIKLPTEFRKWNYDWKVLDRTENYAILSQTFDTFTGYNVCKIIKSEEAEIHGNPIEAKERIPSDSQWGTYAWNFGKDKEAAFKKFEELKNS